MRQGATSQLKQHQLQQHSKLTQQQQPISLNMSQNVSASYHATGSKRPQYIPNSQVNASFHHHHQNTGESSYQPSKQQPSQKPNAQKNNHNHAHTNQHTNSSEVIRKIDMKGLNSKFHSGNSGSRNQNYIGSSHGMGQIGQNQKNVMLSHQTPAQLSQNQSINQQLKYSTPTNVGGQNQKHQINQNSKVQTKQKISPVKNKKYEMTLRLLEGKIIRDYSTLLWKMSTYLTVELKKGKQFFKTQQQPGKNPKWNESFKFEVNNKGDAAKITLFNKFTFQKEDQLGDLVFSLEQLQNYNTTDWFILYDKDQQVGSVLINLTSEEIKDKSESKNVGDQNDADQPFSNSDEGDCDENDVDEELEQSLDYRDHEISRSLIPNNHIKGYERSLTRNGGVSGQGMYKGLRTQQQHQSSTSYLHTQANQPRQSVTENSVIRHYSSHSSDNHSEGVESPNKQNKYYQKDNQKRQSNYNNTGGIISRNIKPEQQMFNPNFASANDEEHILPQQLFYGKNQHHSNSSNNLPGVHQQNAPLQNRFMNPNSNISNSQFLYLDDLNSGGVAVGINSNAHHHQHKQHCKKQKERSSRRNKKHQHHQKDKTKKHQNILGVEQFADEMQYNMNIDGEEEEDEVNYGNYLNQRSNVQVKQQISNSHSQQLLSALAKHNNYDSGGATSNSGGQQQLYQLTNMGLSGSGGNGLIIGSNGSYIPSQQNIMGPSYFEDQNSIESINDAAIVNHHIMNAGQHHQQNNLIMGKTYYDISELQDIEQAKLQLLEENQIISQQEQQLQQFFAQYNQSKAQLNKEIQLFQEQEKQLNEMKKNFQSQLEDFSKKKKQLSAQKKEFKYQKQQLERRFFNMKRERILISQKQKSIDDLYNQFSELVNTSQALKNPQISNSKADEIINLMKNIHYNLQVLNTSDKFQELDRLMQEELIYQQQQQMQGHIQQESTSSCATNSTGNYNFLLQGVQLFNNQNKSPLNQNSPYSMQMQQHNKQQQQLMSQQIGQSNLGLQNNLINQRGRNNSNNHLQIGSSNLSQSSPKVITDLINTEEEVDFLDQDQLFKKNSPRLEEDDSDNNNNQYSAKQFNSHQQMKQNDNQKLFLKTNKGHFLNEQHELSTIMEKELLTSQRRSSNGGGGVGIGTSSLIDNNYKSNQIQQQQQLLNNTGNQYQIQVQTSSFQLPTGELQNNSNKELDEFKEQNKIMAMKIAELEGFQKAFLEKLSYLSSLEQQMLRNANEQNSLHTQSQQQHLSQQQNQVQLSHDEIVHITASEVPTNHNTSQVIQQQFSTNDINNTQVQQQLQQISQQQLDPANNGNNNDQEDSMEFIPDPNFLLKINQNMQMNDGKFGQNNNQPPVKQQNNIMPINPQMFYNGIAFGGNDEEQEEEEYYDEVQQQQNHQQISNNNLVTMGNQIQVQDVQQQQQFIIDNEDGFDPSETNMMMTPDGMMVTQEQFLQMYGTQLDMQMMMNQPNMMFLEGQQQFIFDSNLPQIPIDDQIQYQDFGEVMNDENDYLQNYDCGGTIMHNSNFNPVQPQQLNQQTTQIAQHMQTNPSEQSVQSNVQQQQHKSSPKQGQSQNQLQIKPRNKKEKLPEEEIQRLIDENYNYDENKEVSVIYTEDGRIYDQPKKAKHGIQPIVVKDF